jgi:hypothetical protein
MAMYPKHVGPVTSASFAKLTFTLPILLRDVMKGRFGRTAPQRGRTCEGPQRAGRVAAFTGQEGRMLLKNSIGSAGCDAGRVGWVLRFTPALA